jgi:hypothetical protein
LRALIMRLIVILRVFSAVLQLYIGDWMLGWMTALIVTLLVRDSNWMLLFIWPIVVLLHASLQVALLRIYTNSYELEPGNRNWLQKWDHEVCGSFVNLRRAIPLQRKLTDRFVSRIGTRTQTALDWTAVIGFSFWLGSWVTSSYRYAQAEGRPPRGFWAQAWAGALTYGIRFATVYIGIAVMGRAVGVW